MCCDKPCWSFQSNMAVLPRLRGSTRLRQTVMDFDTALLDQLLNFKKVGSAPGIGRPAKTCVVTKTWVCLESSTAIAWSEILMYRLLIDKPPPFDM